MLRLDSMTLLGMGLLTEFARRHPQARSWISAWSKEVQSAVWRRPQDVKDRYASASILDNERVIFNVKGNAFRLEVRINYDAGIVRVIRCGTHADYDRWT